jgi:hypothetical protein
MNLGGAGKFWFEVKDGCVNYVGGIEISADWTGIRGQMRREQYQSPNSYTHVSFATRVSVRRSVVRDVNGPAMWTRAWLHCRPLSAP